MPSLLGLVFSAALSGVAAGGCASEMDCGLNGVCSSGQCACDAPWEGVACELMGFKPTPRANGYGQLKPPAIGDPMPTTSWGGTVMRGANDSDWHLFVTEIGGKGCGLHQWTHQSTVVHAKASSPVGPFVKQRLVLPHQAHNPQTIVFGDSVYIFHIGSACGTGVVSDCNELFNASSGAGLVGSAAEQGCSGSEIHRASGLDGDFEPVPPNGYSGCNNPSPFIHPNGTLFVACTWSILSAPRPEGPWSPARKISVGGGNIDNVTRTWEDPFLWIDRRGNWHLLSHTWTPQAPPLNTISAHAYSKDGLKWTSSPYEPYNSTVYWEDGGAPVTYSTMERPKLVFDAEGTPTHIVNGVSGIEFPCYACGGHCSHCKQEAGNGNNLDWDFTLVRPLKG